MKIRKDPLPNYMSISQFFWLRFIQPGYVQKLPSSTNWMKLWRYITLELKQSSVWFIPNFSSDAFIKILKKRWSKGDLKRIIKGDYCFYALNEINILSITATVRSDWEKVKKDWLIIKCDYEFVEKNREQLHKIANDINTRMVLITSSNETARTIEKRQLRQDV